MSVRTAFFLTMVIGAGWATWGLFSPTDAEFLTGVVVAMAGLIGFYGCEWCDK